MKTLPTFALFSLLLSCKQPPQVDPCLIDVHAQLAYCVPVDTMRKPYDLNLSQLNKYTAYSVHDQSILLQWIVNNSK